MAPEKVTIAEKWLEVIDRPTGVKGTGNGVGIDRNAVRRMKTSAVYALQEASPRGTDIYVFADGSGLWLNRPNDWYPADEETIAELVAEENDEVEDDGVVEAN
jgi:hypothetical protein